MKDKPKKPDYSSLIPVLLFPFSLVKEVAIGLKQKSMPLELILPFMCLLVWFFTLDLDSKFASLRPWFEFSHSSMQLRAFVVGGIAFSPCLMWAAVALARKKRLSSALTKAFQSAGLKNHLGQVPWLVKDVALDHVTRRLTVDRTGISKSKFILVKENIESALCIHIDDFSEDRRRGLVRITYAREPLPKMVEFDATKLPPSNKYFVGQARSQQIMCDIREVPHLLVAGETSGGKSTFLRQLIFSLYKVNKKFGFVLIDLKGGLEFQLFENTKRIDVIPNAPTAVTRLQKLNKNLDQRLEVLKKAGCKDLEHLQARARVDKNVVTQNIKRVVVVIDEATELFLAGAAANAAQAQTARRVVSRLTRLGRAVGIHVIIGTQRPDARALDTQIKANLGGKVCFQISDLASSLVVLGNGRAKDLPRVAGRAIWQRGLDMVEVQTPFLQPDTVEALLKSEVTQEKGESDVKLIE